MVLPVTTIKQLNEIMESPAKRSYYASKINLTGKKLTAGIRLACRTMVGSNSDISGSHYFSTENYAGETRKRKGNKAGTADQSKRITLR